jgi:hypothetical protein
LSVGGGHTREPESDAVHVLALRDLRADLAPGTSAVDAKVVGRQAMTILNERPGIRWARLKNEETPTAEILRDLHQLIEALDRRVPRLERVGEAQIARDASDLRERASKLILQIEAVL